MPYIPFLFHGATYPAPPLYRGFKITLTHTHTHIHTLGRIPLDERSARHRFLYQTTYNTYEDTYMPKSGFEQAIPETERPQTHDLDNWNRHLKITGLL
jgi:hypothetical protein